MRIIQDRHRVQHFVEDLNGVPLQMILIPEGKFIMGSPESEESSNESERPQHSVQVTSFFMGRYPITNAQWNFVVSLPQQQQKLDFKNSNDQDNHPVTEVSWDDAMEFCARLSLYTKKNYCLPSEAEWEYACRSLISEELTVEEWNKKYHQPFHFGETISTQLANYDGNYTYGRGKKGDYRKKTTAVDFFKVANAFGLSDMHGNVWEWCADPWHGNYQGAPQDGRVRDEPNKNDNYYQNIANNLANLLKDNRDRVLRGGSWDDFPSDCRSAYRYKSAPDHTNDIIGFRVSCGGARAN